MVNKDSDKDIVYMKRTSWGGRFEFLLSCIGYAVGIGNIWRFPYLCMRNGGGAFLIPYFVSLFFCGMPLFLMELSIGQFSSRSPTEVWNMCPLVKGLGWGMALVSGFVCIYYNVIITWVLFYLFRSFTSKLPWANCGNDWNTDRCVDGKMRNMLNASVNTADTNITYTVDRNSSLALALKAMSPAEEYWEREALELSSGIEELGGIKWELFGFLVLSWFLIFICLFKGVQSSGKVVYVTATAPYVFLVILFVRGVTLPGALEGIKYFIVPNFSKLLEIKVWTEASLQIFYSLGPAWGGIITMASYNKFNNNCYRDAMIVPIVNCGTSFFGGFVIFSIIGFMAHKVNLPVAEVVKSGPGLAFIAYPEAITHLPISPMWAIFFFIMLLTLGLDSQFGMFETMLSGILDSFPRLNKYKVFITAGLCIVELFMGLPLVTRGGMYVFQLFDWYIGSFSVMTISFFECIVVIWVYGHERFYYDIECMIGYKPNIWWKICLGGITPVILFCITIYNLVSLGEPYYGDYTYPPVAILFGWAIACCTLVPIPIFFVYAILQQEGSLIERIKKAARPNKHWGPALHENRINYKYSEEYGCEKVPLQKSSQEISITADFV